MKISRKLRRELILITFDLTDSQIDDLEAMCEIRLSDYSRRKKGIRRQETSI